MYPRGHIPDHPAVAAKRHGLHLFRGIGAIRAAVVPLDGTKNRLWLPVSKGGPGIQNQLDMSDCEGFAHSSGATLRLAIAGTPVPRRAAGGLYLGALMADRVPNADGSLPYLIDQGTMPSSILSAWQLWGSTDEATWGQQPASSQTMYADPTGSNPAIPQGALTEPKPEQLYAEKACTFNGAHFIQSTGDQKVLDIMQALAAGYPVSIAIPASGQDYQGYRGGVLGALSGPIDHANMLVDVLSWDGKDPSSAIFIGCNSWGDTGWGESDADGIAGGMYRCSRAFIDQLEDPCVLDVARAQ